MALKKFRDIHPYRVSLHRHPVPQGRRCHCRGAAGAGAGSGAGLTTTMMPSACPMMSKKEREPIRGTGGNELASLLKACRDATTRALLPQPRKVLFFDPHALVSYSHLKLKKLLVFVHSRYVV
jgi:hypothetical protein